MHISYLHLSIYIYIFGALCWFPLLVQKGHVPGHLADVAKKCQTLLRNFQRKAMAISYNWLFLWDKRHSINGVRLVLITGISGLNCVSPCIIENIVIFWDFIQCGASRR